MRRPTSLIVISDNDALWSNWLTLLSIHTDGFGMKFDLNCSASSRNETTDRLTRPSLRTPKELIINFRCFQLLTIYYNKWMSITMFSHRLYIMSLGSVMLYGTIRFFGDINFMAYSLMPMTFIGCCADGTFIDPWGFIIEKGVRNFKTGWKGALRRRDPTYNHFRSFLKSARNLDIELGPFYTFDRTTLATNFKAGFDNALDLLLTF